MDWNAPYMDRKIWILDHLETLSLDAREAMTLLLIDFYNSQNKAIRHEMIAEKLHVDAQDVEGVFLSLSDKGYLNIVYQNGKLSFDIEGVYSQEHGISSGSGRSLIEEFEMEFKRSFNPNEMERILQLGSRYGERMVICALNEAAVYDSRNLNYIENILIAWTRKGLSADDVEKGKR